MKIGEKRAKIIRTFLVWSIILGYIAIDYYFNNTFISLLFLFIYGLLILWICFLKIEDEWEEKEKDCYYPESDAMKRFRKICAEENNDE